MSIRNIFENFAVNLSKILLVGGSDFSYLGRPVLDKNQASIKAMVVEHTRGHSEIQTPWWPGITKAKRQRVFRRKHTILRILEIKVNPLEQV